MPFQMKEKRVFSFSDIQKLLHQVLWFHLRQNQIDFVWFKIFKCIITAFEWILFLLRAWFLNNLITENGIQNIKTQIEANFTYFLSLSGFEHGILVFQCFSWLNYSHFCNLIDTESSTLLFTLHTNKLENSSSSRIGQ